MSTRSSHSARRALILAAALGSIAAPTQAANLIRQFQQAEQRGPSGQLLTEEATIYVVACIGANENGGQFWIYQYHKRPGFRIIIPSDVRTITNQPGVLGPSHWASAIGGRDWPTFQQAVSLACARAGTPQPLAPTVPQPLPPAVNVSGQWRLATNCKFPNPPWQATITLAQAADGSVTASTSNDTLSTVQVQPNTPAAWGSKMKSQVSGYQLTLLLYPNGWNSVLELTGQVVGSAIQGKIHHYGHDDCAFVMSR